MPGPTGSSSPEMPAAASSSRFGVSASSNSVPRSAVAYPASPSSTTSRILLVAGWTCVARSNVIVLPAYEVAGAAPSGRCGLHQVPARPDGADDQPDRSQPPAQPEHMHVKGVAAGCAVGPAGADQQLPARHRAQP